MAAPRAGLLDPESVEAVLAGAGHPVTRTRAEPVLTTRELDVLELTARGLSNREIATALGISERTVGHHQQPAERPHRPPRHLQPVPTSRTTRCTSGGIGADGLVHTMRHFADTAKHIAAMAAAAS